MNYSTEKVDEIVATYHLSIPTVEFLIDMYGEEILLNYIEKAVSSLGENYKEVDIINLCEEYATAKPDTLSSEIDTTFLQKDTDIVDNKINVINNVITYILKALLGVIGCLLLSVVLHINIKYMVSFCIIFIILYTALNLFDRAKE